MRMINVKQNTHTTFEFQYGFIITAIVTENHTGFWIHHENYGIKSYMFGFNEEMEVWEQTLFASANIEEFSKIYEELYMDDKMPWEDNK